MQPSRRVQKSPSSEFPIGVCAVRQWPSPGRGTRVRTGQDGGRMGHTEGDIQGRTHQEPVQTHPVSHTTTCHPLPLPGELLLSHQRYRLVSKQVSWIICNLHVKEAVLLTFMHHLSKSVPYSPHLPGTFRRTHSLRWGHRQRAPSLPRTAAWRRGVWSTSKPRLQEGRATQSSLLVQNPRALGVTPH